MKRCPKCKKTKEFSEFSKSKNAPGGINGWCKECCRNKERLAYKRPEVRERVLARAKLQYRLDPEREHRRKRKYYTEIVTEVFNLLGNKCKKCSIEDKRILQVDHIDGMGGRHRKSLDYAWWRFYREVKNSIKNKENKYQLLCVNCNWIEAVEKGYRKSIWA